MRHTRQTPPPAAQAPVEHSLALCYMKTKKATERLQRERGLLLKTYDIYAIFGGMKLWPRTRKTAFLYGLFLLIGIGSIIGTFYIARKTNIIQRLDAISSNPNPIIS